MTAYDESEDFADGGTVMANPVARKLRLAHALVTLREQAGDTTTSLAARSKVGVAPINRLENPVESVFDKTLRAPKVSNLARRTNTDHVEDLANALGVPRGSDQWKQLEEWAKTGARTYWWNHDAYVRMGSSQKVFAAAEFEATEIFDYGLLLPGPVQTADYARWRSQPGTDGPGVDVDAIVAGRLRRQQQILEGVTKYELIVEEQAIRRWPVSPDIMLGQLRHLLKLGERRNVSILVLPADGQPANGCGAASRHPHTIYTYSEPDDPRIVLVDTVIADLLTRENDVVAGFVQLHDRLRRAALDDADSAALIREVAERVAADV